MTSRAILIYGPTASGKSKLAMKLAKRLDGEIINADSMQVYADLQILTARPSKKDCRTVPHHLFGHVDAAVCHSVADWLIMADRAIKKTRDAGRLPIIVGGSGLYMSALTEGLSAIPQIDPQTRNKARMAVAEGSAYASLLQIDPAAATRIKPSDSQRVARALEVAMATNMSLEEFHSKDQQYVTTPLSDWIGFALIPPRAELYQSIDQRFADMLARGGMDEAQKLMQRKLDPALPVMKAHGVPHLLAGLAGRIDQERAVSLSCRDTRRYAKRQYSWMAHRLRHWIRLPEQKTKARFSIIRRIISRDRYTPQI